MANTTIKNIKQINTETAEGRYLMAALAKLSTESQKDKTPEQILEQLNKLQVKVFAAEDKKNG